ncbi:MAG: hypothetical protein E5W90_22870 [Mesorhizobium sp.]|nr:MAG: hypothetical protein E5W90_22870 [Mesorhizobium sp.]
MTIAERRAREQSERENPWQPITNASPDGMICELRLANLADHGRARFFLHASGWYRIEPPEPMQTSDVIEFRPTGTKLSAHRQASIVEKAKRGKFEYRGGQIFRTPRPYKSYWRADDEEGDK